MATKAVLAIGIDPTFTDRSEFPELSPELIRHYIDTQIKQLCTLGYQAESCLIDLGPTAEATVERALQSRIFDCIVIGAGLRQPPQLLRLFEKIINLVHALAPRARIVFNTTPADTADAVQRWISP